MFEKIDIGIKTFLRDEQLFHAIQGIQQNYPGARLIIVDDGEMTEEKDGVYADLHRAGHITETLPFDSGFGRKSNRISELSTRPYLLIGSDDFEFDKQAAEGLRGLQSVLDNDSEIDIASGRVNNHAYEFYLEISKYLFREGVYVKEHPIFTRDSKSFTLSHVCDAVYEPVTPEFFSCDLTVNYSLIRTDRFRAAGIRWDNDVKIGGGEHGALFYDCKLAGLKTVCVPSSNIGEQRVRNSSRYKEFRNRASSSERPCFDKRNIVEYILGNGSVDYRR